MKTLINEEKISFEQALSQEWLLTNGLGGFACGSISGALMRKYHALLNAALPNPYGRTIMLNFVDDTLITNDKVENHFSFLRGQDHNLIEGTLPVEFRLENGLPIWRYEIGNIVIEKTLLLLHRQNTLHISYRLLSEDENLELRWRPFFHFRANEQAVNVEIPNEAYVVHANDSFYEIDCPGFPPLRLFNVSQGPFTIDYKSYAKVFYEIEAHRGYESQGSLSSPGYFTIPLKTKERVTLIVSTEPWNVLLSLMPKDAWTTENMRKKSLLKMTGPFAKNPNISNLVIAADQFLFTPTTRYEDMIRLQALGQEGKSVLAGFPWFTDWGRDTMISLEGLTLVTGRKRDAYAILLTFARYIMEGLIPNMFPDGENKGIYNTADATLWFFHAIDRYIAWTGDDDILEFLLPKLESIIQHHLNGTLFGIKMDEDGLLIQGHPDLQLTWMDAKVGDWVVTPRRGKAVEINALWYNALCLYETWSHRPSTLSEKCFESFNQKFWNDKGNYLYDVIEGEKGNDDALRPNQLFAISLSHPVLKEDRWKYVLDSVERDLYTPVGLRTLSPRHPDYKATYEGDLRARDAAYHQGSVWPWLLGPYIDTRLKVYPNDLEKPLEILQNLEKHCVSHCLGTIGEIFDACEPYNPRGCFAQAWSVAEVLRCYSKILAKLS